jgi:hypothetical protein
MCTLVLQFKKCREIITGIQNLFKSKKNKKTKKNLGAVSTRGFCSRYSVRDGAAAHGPLKLRTAHLSDNTKIYESKVCVQNVFP